MKVIRNGNVYKKVSWFKEHEKDIYTFLCVVLGFAIFVVAVLIRG